VKDSIYEVITDSAAPGAIEFFHGYTYSGHPAACAAGLASLSLYEEEGLFEQAAALSPYFLEAAYSLRDHPLVKDIRGIGSLVGVELHAGTAPGARGGQCQKDLFWNGMHVKFTGDTGILAPMFIAEKSHIDEMISKLRLTLDKLN
jgi:beta-alanine--pyruvate transaminase